MADRGGARGRSADGPGTGTPAGDARPGGASAGGAPESRAGFLPPEPQRPRAESILVRVVATAGVVAIATAVGAIMGAQDVAAWTIALVVSLISVTLAAVLWRSRLL